MNSNDAVPPISGKSHKIKFYYYAIISIGGLFISVVFFYLAHSLMDMPAFYANWVGDIIALSFVFLCSWIFIFDHSKQQINIKFALNLLAKLLVIYILSTTLSIISRYLDFSPLFQEFNTAQRDVFLALAKVVLAPASLLANYLITFIILEKLYKG